MKILKFVIFVIFPGLFIRFCTVEDVFLKQKSASSLHYHNFLNYISCLLPDSDSILSLLEFSSSKKKQKQTSILLLELVLLL